MTGVARAPSSKGDICLCCGQDIPAGDTVTIVALAHIGDAKLFATIHPACSREWERRIAPAIERERDNGRHG